MFRREFLRHNWHVITIILTAIAIAFAALVLLRGMPPHRIAMATGSENLSLLRDPRSGVSVALIQSGTVTPENASDLESLGTVFDEPLWWFRRCELEDAGLETLRGRKVSIGPEGSGTRAVVLFDAVIFVAELDSDGPIRGVFQRLRIARHDGLYINTKIGECAWQC